MTYHRAVYVLAFLVFFVQRVVKYPLKLVFNILVSKKKIQYTAILINGSINIGISPIIILGKLSIIIIVLCFCANIFWPEILLNSPPGYWWLHHTSSS